MELKKIKEQINKIKDNNFEKRNHNYKNKKESNLSLLIILLQAIRYIIEQINKIKDIK